VSTSNQLHSIHYQTARVSCCSTGYIKGVIFTMSFICNIKVSCGQPTVIEFGTITSLLLHWSLVCCCYQAMMHLQQQQQQQQLLASQNGTLFGSQSVFMPSPVTTSSAVPSGSMLPYFFVSANSLMCAVL